MNKNLLILITTVLCFNVNAQTTFYGSGGPIPDLTTVQYPFNVSGLPTTINSTFGLENVCFDISHTYDGDLQIKLQSPDGTTIILSDRRGGGGDDFSGTCFRGNGAQGMISAGAAPFNGTYIPDGNLSLLNNGQNPNGTWLLIVADMAGADTGNVNSMTIRFGNDPTPTNPVASLPCSMTNVANCFCPDSLTTDCDLLPDMTASAKIIQDTYVEFNGNITLGNATPNIGYGPLEIHGINTCYCDTVQVPCTTPICPDGSYPKQLVNQTIYHRTGNTMTTWTRPAGTMSYHPTHGHIHVDNWAWFTLRVQGPNPDASTWPIIGQGSKVAFCLINLGNCTSNYGYCIDGTGDTLTMADIHNAPFGMVSGCGIDQGIYTGNLDIYSSGLNGMGILIPNSCNGNYYIVSITDPNNNMLESDETNNWAAVPVTLTLQQNIPVPVPSFVYTQPGLTVNLTSTSLNTDSVRWDFGDNTSLTTTSTTASHTYAGDGVYAVTMWAYNQCGPRYAQDTITIITTGIGTPNQEPISFKSYPNPFDNSTRISYYLASESNITLDVFNSLGEKVTTLFDGKQLQGKYEFSLGADENKIGNGVYFVRLTSPSKVSNLRIVRIH
ncbi:MAG: proprotein convertase P-domain-containing protein [Bacteroidia bacterium]|nr:proprotein convertase P-domain-containing protein [Bacteroidia bacterium]